MTRGRVGGSGAVAPLLGLTVALCAARAAAQTPGEPPFADETGTGVHRYVVQPYSDGTYEYDGRGFTASIKADGTVEFHDVRARPSSHVTEGIASAVKGEAPKPLEWPFPLPTYYRPTPYDDLNRQINRDNPPQIPVAAPIFIDPALRVDVTDEYVRAMGQDPYAAEKAAFLADTFDFRMALAARQQGAAVRQALGELPDRLVVIWTDPAHSPAERRRIIRLLWEETSDDDAGAAARRIIGDFARKNFPRDEAARFTE